MKKKKPLYHFQPKSWSYSVGTVGCNFRCPWCQNFEIAQWPQLVKKSRAQKDSRARQIFRNPQKSTGRHNSHKRDKSTETQSISGEPAPSGTPVPPGHPTPPGEIVSRALQNNCRNISYTYNEPTVFFEYAWEIARQARDNGLANVFVTNGFMTREMLDRFYPLLDAANVDMKGFRDRTYRRYSGAQLQPVLENLKILKEQGVWLEVTTLVIPDINDDPGEASEMADFIVRELGADTPWHISRFFPAYKMKHIPPTPLETLHQFRDIGHRAGIKYVYLGNVSGRTDTVCHACGQTLIARSGLFANHNRIASDGTCSDCGTPVPGVDMAG